jgi:hypothetical protein
MGTLAVIAIIASLSQFFNDLASYTVRLFERIEGKRTLRIILPV